MCCKTFLILVAVLILILSLFIYMPGTMHSPGLSDTEISHRTMSRSVYGFWPYWVSTSNYNPDWADLTYVMYFGASAQADGSLDLSHMDNFYSVEELAVENRVSIAIVVDTYDQSVQDSILAEHRTDMVNSILTMLDKYPAQGVLVDFPNIRATNSYTGGSNTQLWEEFMKTLYNAVKYRNASYLVAFSVSGSVPSVFQNSNLAQYTDAVYLRGYEYHGMNAAETGAVAPLNDSSQYDVADAVSTLKTYFPGWKIILGVPLYGYEWPASSDEPGAQTTGAGTEYSMREMEKRAGAYGVKWDSSSHTPWYAYQSGGQWYQGWYDNRESLREKWKFVIYEGLGGTGLWSLSNEDPGIWEDLEKIFWSYTNDLSKEVYAFYPYWINFTWYQTWYNPDMWHALTYVAYSEAHANADGTLDLSNMTWYWDLYNEAKSHGVKVTISIANTHASNDQFDADIANQILASHRAEFANNVLSLVQKYKADGVCIDFELLQMSNPYSSENNQVLFEELMKQVYTTLKNANPDYHVSFCVPYFIGDVFKNAELAKYADNVFLMGYDYYFQDPSHTGPVAPFNDPTRLDEVDSVLILENYFPKWKIILGVPFYGRHWLATGPGPGANATYGGPILMRTAVQLSKEYTVNWDANSHTPWFEYKGSDGYYHQIWFDNNRSLAIKWMYVRDMGLGGTGIWSLGSEQPSIWYTLLGIFQEAPQSTGDVPEFSFEPALPLIAVFAVVVIWNRKRE